MGEHDSVQVKFECKEVDPCENSRAVHTSPHNSGTVIDSERRSINANRQPSAKVVRHPYNFRLSVTLRYREKKRERRGMRSSPSIAQCL